MNGFRKLQQRLREEGWYLGWNHYCCQNCAWMDVPDYFDAQYDKDGYLIREDKDGNEIEYKEVDLSKVLFNHSQDCEYDFHEVVYEFFGEDDEAAEEFMDAYSDAIDDDQRKAICEEFDCQELLDDMPEGMLNVGSFVCYPPEQQSSSMFCFDGSKKGVKNFKEIIPIIEECGCAVQWDGTGDTRIEISWELE